nr:hypothetical protein [Tanacetum cinerariifolium]
MVRRLANTRMKGHDEVLLIRHGTSDSEPDISFYITASLGYVSSLGRASPVKVVSHVFPSEVLGVIQTLYKQGHWFSFAELRASSPVCIDDNWSCMNGWKSGLFLIDRRAIPYYVSWRHPDSAISNSKPLLAVMGIHDFLCLPEWIGLEVQEEIHQDVRPSLQRLPFYYIPSAASNATITMPTLKDLSAATSNSKVLAKAKDFFPSAHVPYYATYTKYGVVTGSYEASREEWEGPHQPTLMVVFRAWFRNSLLVMSLAGFKAVKATPLIATTDYHFLKKIFDHAAHPLSIVLNLNLGKLARLEVVPASKTTRVSPSLERESNVTLVSSSLEFPSNVITSSTDVVVEQPSLEQNEEWVRAMVDIPNVEMVDAISDKMVEVFV